MKVLIVDDDRGLRRGIRAMLARLDNVEIHEADSLEEASELLVRHDPELALIDIRLSDRPGDRGGLELLRELRASSRRAIAVMVTSSSEVGDIREAMRLGARDYVLKDELCPEMLLPIVEDIRDRVVLRAEVRQLRQRVDRSFGIAGLIGSSPAMDEVRRLVVKLADASSTILVRGDTGTGKELVARALHDLSTRRHAPFLALNCSALPGNLMESIIFGHERGAFTGADRRQRGQLELTGSGTILLDEIAEMPLDLQAKLLRVLEERRFRPLGAETELPLRARVLAATHVDLEDRIAQGRFREDLYYRLDVVSITMPPLSARSGDIVELLLAFVAETSRNLRFTGEAVTWLTKRRWRGNVRELRNVVERLALLADDDVVDLPTLQRLVLDRDDDARHAMTRLAREILALPADAGSRLRSIERAIIEEAMEASGHNKAAAARMLRIDRKAFERRWDRARHPVDEDD